MVPDSAGSDRRRFPRVNVTCDVRYAVSSEPDVVLRAGSDEKRATMVNVSEGGMAIVTEVALPEETKLGIDLTLPAVQKKIPPVHVFGQVCYTLALVDQIHYHVGIEFIAMKDRDRRAIAAFVRSRSRGDV